MSKVYRGKDGRLYDGFINYILRIPSPALGWLDAGVEIGKHGMDYGEWLTYNYVKLGEYARRGMDEGMRAGNECLEQFWDDVMKDS